MEPQSSGNSLYATRLLSDYTKQDVKKYKATFESLFGGGGPRPLVAEDIANLLWNDPPRQSVASVPMPAWLGYPLPSEANTKVLMVVKDVVSGTWDLVLDTNLQFQSQELRSRSYWIRAWSYRRPSSLRPPSLRPRPAYLPYFSGDAQKTRMYVIELADGFRPIVIITDPPPMVRIVDRGVKFDRVFAHKLESKNDLFEIDTVGNCLITRRRFVFLRPRFDLFSKMVQNVKQFYVAADEDFRGNFEICVDMDDIVWPPNFDPDMPLLDRFLFVGDLLDSSRTLTDFNWRYDVVLWPDDMFAGPISNHPRSAGGTLRTFVTFGPETQTTLYITADDVQYTLVEPTEDQRLGCKQHEQMLELSLQPIMDRRRETADKVPPIVRRHDDPIEMENDAARRAMCANEMDPSTQFELDYDDDVVTLFNDDIPPRGTCYQRDSIINAALAGQLKYKWVGGIHSGHLDFSSPYYLVFPEKRYLVDGRGVEEVRSSGESLFLIKGLGKFNVGHIDEYDVPGYHSTQTIYTLIPLTRNDLIRLGLNYTPKIRNDVAAEAMVVDQADAMTRARIRRPREEVEEDERNVRRRNTMQF